MDTPKSFALIVLALAFVIVSAPAYAQAQLPEMELRVTGVEGTAEIKPDTADEWNTLSTKRALNPGDRVRTDEEATVELEVPSVSYFRITESSLIEVRKLDRKEEERGLLVSDTVVVNDVKLKEVRGKVQSSLKDREGVANDYELETPNAVAGIRGTDFQCEVTDFGQTNCAVLEGNVEFSSLENRDASVSLGAGQQSSVGPDENQPSEPTQLSDENREELQQVQRRAESALRLPPALSSFELNGTAFQQSVSLAYSEQTSLTLSGTASAPGEGAQLTRIRASVNGEERSVEGLSEWSLTLEPEAPASGEQRELTITLQAVDSNEKQSDQKTLTITLVNQSDRTQSTTEGLPEDYEEGRVDVELVSLAGRAPENIEYPLHLYRPDASEGGLTIQGTARGEASIENVAYSLDNGQTWTRATGASNWTVNIPADRPGEFSVLVRAWTTEGVIGSPVEFGPIEYQPITYEQAMRETFDAFWTAFEREDPQGVVAQLHPDFQYTPENAGGEGERVQTLDRSNFQDFLRDEFNRLINIRAFYSINTIFGNPQGGELRADPIEWKFQDEFSGQSDNQTSSAQFFPAAVKSDGSFKYRRNASGQFRILSFDDFQPTFFMGFDDITMGDTHGYTRGPADRVIDNGVVLESFESTDVAGWLIAGLDFDDTIWPGDPPKLYVNPGGGYPNPHSWCGCGNGEVVAGGIYKTPYSSFSEVDRIPEIGSTKYNNGTTGLSEGDILAVNIRIGSGEKFSYLLQVREINFLTSTPTADEIVFRAVTPKNGHTTSFNGVNPFD